MSKSTPAPVGPRLKSTFPPRPKQKLETHSYSTLLKKSKKLSLSIFFWSKKLGKGTTDRMMPLGDWFHSGLYLHCFQVHLLLYSLFSPLQTVMTLCQYSCSPFLKCAKCFDVFQQVLSPFPWRFVVVVAAVVVVIVIMMVVIVAIVWIEFHPI